ncbi:MAG: GTPase [Candidatus Diapherotrites archaeon]
MKKNRRKIPSIDTENPIIVLAGYPNTGKTTILSRITSSKPKIAGYAFTTQDLNMGKMNYKFFELQVMDTPGLLDREKNKMNEIERKAAAALKYIASIILFVIDASKSSGYEFEKQMHLLKETKNAFPRIPMIVLLNKTDLAEKKEIEEKKEKIREFEKEINEEKTRKIRRENEETKRNGKEIQKTIIPLIECGKGNEKELIEKLKKELDELKLKFK